MPVCLTHILDQDATEDTVGQSSFFLHHMPADCVRQKVMVIGRTPPSLIVPSEIELSGIARRFNWLVTSGPDLKRRLAQHQPDIVYAWGVEVASVVGLAWFGRTPIVVTVLDPAEARRPGRWWPGEGADDHRVMVLCPSKLVQIRLVERVVPLSATKVIGPGVDISAIKEAKKTFKRSGLGLPEKGRVMLTISPPTRAGGQYYAVWAAAILHNIWPDACLLIPGVSKEQRRLLRLIDNIYCPDIYFATEDRYTPAELLAVSDMLIVPALDDIPTTWLVWAMAASVPIVASAVPAITELIQDEENGFLCKPGEPHTLAIAIRTAAESDGLLGQCAKKAQSQARRLFKLEKYVEEQLEVIDHLLNGKLMDEDFKPPKATRKHK
ncbi:MAG: glycosyltransferase family 4 protein [Planctomycetota bacterium]|jgi:glycosyltransferase involved in cell wall biosynthesis